MSGAREDRIDLALRLRRAKRAVAERVTSDFFVRHPEWTAWFGARGRDRGVEDAEHHVDFLAAAIETDSPRAFADYGRWSARVLATRAIDPRFLVENLEQVRDALGVHLDAASRAVVERFVSEGCLAAREPVAATVEAIRGLFVQTLLAGDRVAAYTIVEEELRQGAQVLDVYVRVLQDALYEIGHLWEANAISVAQEHMATAIVELILNRLYDRLPLGPRTRGRALIVGVQGEFHQVGARMVADALELDGWDVRFLGANVPSRDVLALLREGGVRALGLSCALLTHVPALRELIADAKALPGPRPPAVVGGAAFRKFPELAKEVGADASALDLQGAIGTFRSLPVPA